MTFLDGRAAEKHINQLLDECSWARIAVSYWGKGACKRLQISNCAEKDILIVCHARSGGCNITELGLLRSVLGDERVLTRDKLHAKLWLTDVGAVIGSSNASSNGFGVEGQAASGLIEANVLIDQDDKALLSDALSWFDTKVLSASRRIDDDDLREGDRQRHKRGLVAGAASASLIEELEQNPAAYAGRDVYVWIWPFEDTSVAAEKRVRQEAERRSLRGLDFWEDQPRSALLPPGSFVIEFDSNGRSISHEGIYRVLDRSHALKHGQDYLLLSQPARSVLGAKLGDLERWRAAARAAIRGRSDRTWEGTLHDFASAYLLR